VDSAEPARLLAERYRLRLIIGHGGMGAVWQARDEVLGRNVAVKEIVWPQLSEAERDTARRRAVREARVAARLSHPNVVAIYDIVEEDGRPWIVMELVPYRSLRDIVREDGPLRPAKAAEIGLGVLAALRAAHAEGIVHRDVKPANILIGPEDRVVLTDFGIARAADSTALTTSGVLVGSPSYIAPERARRGQDGAAGDLWALGASLYAAVEGRPPFDRCGALASLTAVVTEEPDPAPHAGPLWPVISGLLRKDPGERLDAAEAERLLRQVADGGSADWGESLPPGEVTLIPGMAPSPRGTRGSRHTGTGLVVLAVAVLVIAVAAIAIVLRAAGSSAHKTTSSSATPTASATASATATPTAGGGYAALPAGYYRFTNSTGFSIGVPAGWQISHTGQYVYIRDPSDSGIFLLIDQSDDPQPDPLADWEQQQANRESSYPDYHLIRLESVNYPQAEKAADWEFTYDRDGVPVHILNRNVLANAQHAYALYWSTPETDWNAYFHYFQAFAASFRPAS
jgi:eukaryotic-like serine/threonine-protein kinase